MRKYELISKNMGRNQRTSFAMLRPFEGLGPMTPTAMKYERAEIANMNI
jgi:hypothetical protein